MALNDKQKQNFAQAKEYFATHPDAHKWKKMGKDQTEDLTYMNSPSFIKIDGRILMIENDEYKTIGKGAFAKVLKCCDETGKEYAVRVSGIQNLEQNAKMAIIKDKGLTDFSTHTTRESTSQKPTGENEKHKYTHKIYEPLFRGKSIESFINESPKLDTNSSEYRKQKLDLAISAFQELEENYIGKNHPHLDIKITNMAVFTHHDENIIKFIDVPIYELEINPTNNSKAKFTESSEELAYTPILYKDAFKDLGTNIKNTKICCIEKFIFNAQQKKFQDKKNFFCYDRLTLLSTLIMRDQKDCFLREILKNDAELINKIICGTEINPFNNIFLEKKNVLKVFFITLRADIKIDFDNLLKLAEKDDVIEYISQNPDNPLVIFKTLKKAGINIQNQDSNKLLEIKAR